MPENIEAWWERRQWSKGAAVPYAVGTYRAEWAKYPMLVRQYHPDLNREITLTQIPPAADVYLTWQCDTGHLFVATPEEQRSRPGRVRRRSAWCPVCADLAAPRRIRPAALWPATPSSPADAPERQSAAGARGAPSAVSAGAGATRPGRSARPLPTRPAGEAFRSAHAPATASAAEALLRQKLAARLEFDPAPNAVAVARPFHGRLEVWPDIVIAELRVVLEYDTVGRFGLEHVGPREDSDRSKDRLLRAAGWEVVRIRCAPLPLLGPHDLPAPAKVTDRLIARLLDTLRTLRGDLIVNAYLRP
ncbi:zinc-ribbon domain-containing protein [Herbiconiux sp. UC225_62]|uniref:zinc-ribbon domain-containing protein n=1 Tax=Herbiconiux sp. UC225_62 TaxID=3350168 RepID=UPI0036D2ECB0